MARRGISQSGAGLKSGLKATSRLATLRTPSDQWRSAEGEKRKADPVLEEKMSFYLLKFLLIASHLNHLE